MTAPETPWMLLPEVVAYSRVPRTTLLAALNDGRLRGHQVTRGGKWRVHRDDVDAWLRGEPVAPITGRAPKRAS